MSQLSMSIELYYFGDEMRVMNVLEQSLCFQRNVHAEIERQRRNVIIESAFVCLSARLVRAFGDTIDLRFVTYNLSLHLRKS